MEMVRETLYFCDISGKTVDEFCEKLKQEVARGMEFQEGKIIDVELGTESNYGVGEYPCILVTVERPETKKEKEVMEKAQRQHYEFLRKKSEGS